jgi:hypothetical protein
MNPLCLSSSMNDASAISDSFSEAAAGYFAEAQEGYDVHGHQRRYGGRRHGALNDIPRVLTQSHRAVNKS